MGKKVGSLLKANQLSAHIKEIKKYVDLNVSIAAIHKIINPKLNHKMTYQGMRTWMINNNIISHVKRKKNSDE